MASYSSAEKAMISLRLRLYSAQPHRDKLHLHPHCEYAMSHPHENFNLPNPEFGIDHLILHCSISNVPFAQVGLGQYPPQPALNQEHPVVSDFADGSGHIFSMYLEMATEEDKKMVEDWKADADGILIFVRLYLQSCASASRPLNGHRLVYSQLLSQR